MNSEAEPFKPVVPMPMVILQGGLNNMLMHNAQRIHDDYSFASLYMPHVVVHRNNVIERIAKTSK